MDFSKITSISLFNRLKSRYIVTIVAFYCFAIGDFLICSGDARTTYIVCEILKE